MSESFFIFLHFEYFWKHVGLWRFTVNFRKNNESCRFAVFFCFSFFSSILHRFYTKFDLPVNWFLILKKKRISGKWKL